MLDFVESVVKCFRDCFSREAAWGWFVVLVVGFMLRSDHLGVTSVIRDLALAGGCYEAMMHFFRASSWSLTGVRQRWYEVVARLAPLYREPDGRIVLVGDGTKQPKEARRMPGVKRLHQESEDSSKPEYIFGHMYGGLGVLAGWVQNWACIPLSMRIHDGLQKAGKWIGGCAACTASHVVRMIREACDAARTFGDALLLLDSYFLSSEGLKVLNRFNSKGGPHVDIITKAKSNCVAYEKPGPRLPGRPGAPRKRGPKVTLMDLFVSRKADFWEAEFEIYGVLEQVRFLAVNLLWGKDLDMELRFVLAEMSGTQIILVTTDLEMDPRRVIQLYGRRFSIEHMFRVLKQAIGAFCYRFWSKYMPKLNHFQKKGAPGPLERVDTPHARKMVLKAAQAIEMHAMISCIAMGILQCLSLRMAGKVKSEEFRYLRTPSKGRVSEATIMYWLRRHILRLLDSRPDLCISQKILAHQEDPWEDPIDS